MPSRSSRKTTPRVEQAIPANHPQETHFTDWMYSGNFYALQIQAPSGIDPRRIHLRVFDRVFTAILPGFAPERRTLPEYVNPNKGEAEWCVDTLWVRFPRTDVEAPAHAPPIIDREKAAGPIKTITIDFDPPVTPIIRPRKAKTHERRMQPQRDTITVAKDGTFVKGGVRYHSLYAAAPLAHTHPTTLLNWIKNGTRLNGKALQTFYFAPAEKYFISEESIERAANRFIKWPSQQPAGKITFGETDDRSGYISLPAARAVLGISNRTMYLWATQQKAPTDKPLDVIKDPISEHLYIRERDVYELKRLVPRSGLQRGRRPTSAPSPA